MAQFFGVEISEAVKKEYLQYLQESEVFPKLLEILSKLHKKKIKPRKPIDFIRKELGDETVPMETTLYMECDLYDAQDEIKRLQQILKKLGVTYEKDD